MRSETMAFDGLAHGFDMLVYRRTSILESTAQTLVNTVNCVGVMGKGLAHAFREREPSMFAAYKNLCDRGLLEPGKLWLWRGNGSWILNFPTKKHWRQPSKLEWVEAGLKKFVDAYEGQGIREISFPRLGCGNGGLDWDDVRPLMETYLSGLPIPVYIHDYTKDIGLPEHLEVMAEQLTKEVPATGTFESFVTGLRRATELGGSQMTAIDTTESFKASIQNEDLLIEESSGCWRFELDDLRGVWIGLGRGLVTSDKAGWQVGGGGKSLLSLLSVLPEVRPVEIQKGWDNDPEVAIEFRPELRRIATAIQSAEQHELAWG